MSYGSTTSARCAQKTPHMYRPPHLRSSILFGSKHHAPIAAVIKSQVEKFNDERLNAGKAGDQVGYAIQALEVTYRRATAEMANAICVAFKEASSSFDVATFASACGLYVSDGRGEHGTYSGCHPGQLTWERPVTVEPAASLTMKEARLALVRSTSDAFSFSRYRVWSSCVAALLNRGYNESQVDAILRSKISRWAADHAEDKGRATSADLLRFMDSHQHDVREVLSETGLLDAMSEMILSRGNQ